jgi:hypothetical protein
MELLLTTALEAAEWSLRRAQHVWGFGSEPSLPDPASVVDSLSICYFPELQTESLRLSQVRHLMLREARAEQLKRLQARGPDGSLPAVDPLANQYVQLMYGVLLPQCEIVAHAGADIMNRVLDAGPGDRIDLLPVLNAALVAARDFMAQNGRMDPLRAVFSTAEAYRQLG